MLVAPLLCSAAAILSVTTTSISGHAPAQRRPNILHVLMDDFGWAEVGFHRDSDAAADVSTPVLDALAAEALELRRFYAHKICSPTRCALQTGRAPIHVNTVNVSGLSLSVCLCLSVSLSLCLCLSVCLTVSLSHCLTVSLSH